MATYTIKSNDQKLTYHFSIVVLLNNVLNNIQYVIEMEMLKKIYCTIYRFYEFSLFSTVFLWKFYRDVFSAKLLNLKIDYLFCSRLYDALFLSMKETFLYYSQPQDDVHEHNLVYRVMDVLVNKLKYTPGSLLSCRLSNSNDFYLKDVLSYKLIIQ